MSEYCKDCGVISRNPCSRRTGRNRFDGCYNLTEEEQLLALGDPESLATLELLRLTAELQQENDELRKQLGDK